MLFFFKNLLIFFGFVFVVNGLFFCGEAGGCSNEELWKACAGPLVDVPRAGQRVYYFPQGHMEQVSFSIFLM
jgi:hypothetical protein